MTGDSVLDRLRARPPGGRAVLFPKGGVRLHAMVTSAGYDRCRDRDYEWHGLRRGEAPFTLVQHTLSGGGSLRFEGQRYDVQPGQTMLLRFPHDNRYWLGASPEWEFFWLCLNGREVLRLWADVMRQGPVVALSPGARDRLAGLALAVLQGEADTAGSASAIAYAAAMSLVDDVAAAGASPARPAGVERAIGVCRAAPERVGVARMAAAAGLSRHHFSRVFAASEGVGPARYLLQLRMERAALLLRTERTPVREVARRCGFADANYFAKAFRRMFAISPSEFRNSGAFGPGAERLSAS